MSRLRVYARNLLANWVGYGVNLVVMFFLSPFVVHQLGSVAYGIWSLLISISGFLSLAELGVGGGLGQYLNYHLARREIKKVNTVINTSLVFFFMSGLIMLLCVGALSMLFGSVFKNVPSNYLPAIKMSMFLIGFQLWISFFYATFNQILASIDRFDLQNIVKIMSIGLQASGTVFVLSWGGGIVGLALVQLACGVFGMLFTVVLVRRVFPEFSLRPASARLECFREMFGFSLWAFVGKIAFRMLYWMDIVLIGILLTPKHVAYYSIAAMLVMHARGFIIQSSFILTPQIVKDCALRNWGALQNIFSRGSTMVMAIGIPMFVGFVVFGKEFISLWMGREYVISYRILAILSLAQLPSIAAALTGSVFSGLHKIHIDAGFTVLQCVLNLIFTVLFVVVFKMGLAGVAWGTFLPRVGVSLLALFVAVRMARLSWREFVNTVLWRWVILLAAFWLICICLDAVVIKGGWFSFSVKVGASLMIYAGLVWGGLMSSPERKETLSLVFSQAA